MAKKQLRRESMQRLKLGAILLLAMAAYFAFRVWVAEEQLEQEAPSFEIDLSDFE